MARELSMLDHVTDLIMNDSEVSDQEALTLMNRLESMVGSSLPELEKQWFEVKKNLETEIKQRPKTNLANKNPQKPSRSQLNQGLQKLRAGLFSGSGKKKELIEKLMERKNQRSKINPDKPEFEVDPEIPNVDVDIEIKKSKSSRDSRNLSPIFSSKSHKK